MNAETLDAKLRAAPGSFGPVRIVPGTRIGRYRITGELGQGFYRAYDLRHRRMVALRTVSGGPRPARDRFVREARGFARFRHPAIIAVHDAGVHEGIAFASLELVEGRTLADELASSGPFASATAASIVRALAEGIQAAHDRRISHGSVELAHVVLDGEGEPRLGGFGLGREISLYAGRRLDIRGLGAILRDLTGRGAMGTDLEAICRRALEKDPRIAYPSARALAADLDCFLADEPIGAPPASLVERIALRLFSRRRVTR
ncbi:MAG: protein kinase [Planctomycetota bacterium]